MTPQQRNEIIADFASAHPQILAALEPCPKKMWEYKPEPGQWSIHQIVWHLADSETIYYGRCKKIIAEPRKLVMTFNQDKWADASHYHANSVKDALELIRLLRSVETRLLKGLPADAWKRTMRHPEAGIKSLEDWLVMNTNHVHTHLKQIQRTFEAWEANQ